MLISSMWFIPMSEANIVPSVIPRQPVGVAESVGVDFAQRVRVAVRGELVGRRNRVVAEAFRPAWSPTDCADRCAGWRSMIESRRCVWPGLLAFGPPPLLNPMIAAAGVEQAVVRVAGLGRRVELDRAQRMRQVVRRRGPTRRSSRLVPANTLAAGIRRVPLRDDVVVGHVLQP